MNERILILGNGFDIDHNLPTSYKDFLLFCQACTKSDTSTFSLNKTCDKFLKKISKRPEKKDAFLKYITGNSLLHYFNIRKEKLGNNWIDFEQELRAIVNCFRGIENELIMSNNDSISVQNNHIVHQILADMNLACFNIETFDERTLTDIHKRIKADFDNLSSALNYYIYEFINATHVYYYSPDIINFNANKILTFNYSNTYERIYSGFSWNEESVYHVHGSSTNDYNKIILGITSQNNTIRYLEFEKFYQRITKKTGKDYLDWFYHEKEKTQNKTYKIEVAIFGHSLDCSDRDVLMYIFDNTYTKITIYYYDIGAYQTIVSNLVELLGKEKLLSYISGISPKITFRKQSEHSTIQSSGLNILKDIRKIIKLYQLTQNEADALFNKISQKITSQDINYFFSQKNVIDLYEALLYQQISNYDMDCFLNICKKLKYPTDAHGNIVYFDIDDWRHEDFKGDFFSEEKVIDLIEKVNENNKDRYYKDPKKNLVSKILTANNASTITSLLDSLLDKDPSNELWNEVETIIALMIESVYFEEAVKQLEMNQYHSISKRSKVKHFVNLYNESNYYYLQYKTM